METASIVVRNLPLATKQGLRELALSNARSMEEEARQILQAAVVNARAKLAAEQPVERPIEQLSVGHRIHARFAAVGGVEVQWPERLKDRPQPNFSLPRQPTRTRRTTPGN